MLSYCAEIWRETYEMTLKPLKRAVRITRSTEHCFLSEFTVRTKEQLHNYFCSGSFFARCEEREDSSVPPLNEINEWMNFTCIFR